MEHMLISVEFVGKTFEHVPGQLRIYVLSIYIQSVAWEKELDVPN
jgi:hypothetical protein